MDSCQVVNDGKLCAYCMTCTEVIVMRPSHGGNTGSNPVGSVIFINWLRAAPRNHATFPGDFRTIPYSDQASKPNVIVCTIWPVVYIFCSRISRTLSA